MSRFHERVKGVYFDDLDPFGILHNARYLLLFERVVGSFWQELGFGALQSRGDGRHVVRANTIQYLVPVRGTGEVRVRVWVEHLGTTSLTFGFKVLARDENVVHAEGTRVIVRVDFDTWKAAPWTDELRTHLAPYVLNAD
ncbi:MAG: acyl-CoA thioester hydrolase [Kiritimatiellia bacterium]|jgi:acyl-CoA thioester hydrolase